MSGKESKIAILALFALIGAFGVAGNGYGAALPEGQSLIAADRHVSTSQVEIYRSDDRRQDGKLKMIDLCHRLEYVLTRDQETIGTDVEVHRESEELGGTEYRREVHESNQFADPVDEQRLLGLCRDLEYSVGRPQEGEVRVYRERVVPR